MQEEIKARFANYSNEKLMEVLVNRSEYTPEAVQMAEEMIAQRNISHEVLHSLQSAAEAEREKVEMMNNEPLATDVKWLYLIFPLSGWIGFAGQQLHYHEEGFERKKAEHARYTLIGTGIWIAVILLISLLV